MEVSETLSKMLLLNHKLDVAQFVWKWKRPTSNWNEAWPYFFFENQTILILKVPNNLFPMIDNNEAGIGCSQWFARRVWIGGGGRWPTHESDHATRCSKRRCGQMWAICVCLRRDEAFVVNSSFAPLPIVSSLTLCCINSLCKWVCLWYWNQDPPIAERKCAHVDPYVLVVND